MTSLWFVFVAVTCCGFTEGISDRWLTRSPSNWEGYISKQDADNTTWDGAPRSRHRRAVYGAHGFDPRSIRAILAVHNERRGLVEPTAADMKYMTWDVELQEFAQRYAYQCDFRHQRYASREGVGGFFVVGENTWVGTNYNFHREPRTAVLAWFKEAAFYNYYTMTCSKPPCGHYTQGVWAETHAVGCGMAQCESISDAPRGYHWIVICNYGDGGNYVGERPYRQGRPCSSCPAGYRAGCQGNVCMPDITCNGLTCANGGTMGGNCICNCPKGTEGALCQGSLSSTFDALKGIVSRTTRVTTRAPTTARQTTTTSSSHLLPVGGGPADLNIRCFPNNTASNLQPQFSLGMFGVMTGLVISNTPLVQHLI